MCTAIEKEEVPQYPHFGKVYVPTPFAVALGVTMWSIDDYCGSMKNIYFKDISITAYEGIQFSRSRIKPDETYGKISDIHFENFTLNGKKIDICELGADIDECVTNVFFE